MGIISRTLLATLVAGTLACGSEEAPRATGPSMGGAPESRDLSAGNRPPVIERVTLRPESPAPGERVTADVNTSDPDGDKVLLSFEWRMDGQRIPDATRSFLQVRNASRGRLIEVLVTASDGIVQAGPESASARVGNQLPVVLGVVIEPLGPVTRANDIVASPRGSDPDGDDVEFEFNWVVNGQPAFADGPTLTRDQFKRGDRIEVTVIATDGEDESDPLRSAPFEVENAPPKIISTPGAFDDDGAFRYQVAVQDPDQDRRFRYRLLQSPDGMEVDLLDGLVVWEPDADQTGNFPVVVEVDDTKGGKHQQSFEVRVAFEGDTPANTP